MTAISVHSGRLLLHEGRDVRLEPGGGSLFGGAIAGLEPDASAPVQIDASGADVLPGLVDCHTHLPFAGWRADEYEMKVTGVPYEEIARRGGGIAASARALERAGDGAVLRQARDLAREMLAHGTTAFECKSGYGLSPDEELRALRLAGELGERVVQRTASTALLAHAVPDGYTADGWMDEVERLVPEVEAQALDIYVESVAFSVGHLARMGELAARHGLALRAHVEQFSTSRSVPVALEHGARSVDHLACLHPDDLAPLAAAECAAVLLPGAEFLGDEQLAPGRALVDAGAICVLATDCNPGTSPIASLLTAMNMACVMFRLTAAETLRGVTANAARALGLADDRGVLQVGKRADLSIWRLRHPEQLCAEVGVHRPAEIVLGA